MILLTDEEIRPFVQCLQEEAVVDIDGLLKAQLKKVVEWLKKRYGAIDPEGEIIELYIDGEDEDWQALLEETK